MFKKPLNVEEIVREAGNFDYNAQVPLRSWLRTADAVQKQSQAYERDGNDQEQYRFLMRHAILVTEKLPSHPEYSLEQHRPALRKAKKDVSNNLRKLEVLKPRIKRRHEYWRTKTGQNPRNKAPSSVEQSEDITRGIDALSLGDRSERDVDVDPTSRRELNPYVDQELAARLAKKELKLSRRDAFGGPTSPSYDGLDDLASHIRTVGQRGAHVFRGSEDPPYSRVMAAMGAKSQYPAIPQKHADSAASRPGPHSPDRSVPPRNITSLRDHNAPPALPPKHTLQPDGLPTLPAKVAHESQHTGWEPPQTLRDVPSRASTSTPDLKSSDFTFTSTACTESGAPLRTVFLAPDLRLRFLSMASSNTTRNLETCGVLCGQLMSNAFFITTLIVPEQESTSDTCDTKNEEALFDYCDSHDLLTLGWIHTHPTQSCFMSSRDLHTHGGYQVQMAESIAIVCAPQHEPSWGVFRMTDPPGLKTILNCTKTGVFHPHEVDHIYTDALKPGHVWELPGLDFEIVDLRP